MMGLADLFKFAIARSSKDSTGFPGGIVGSDGIIRRLHNRRFATALVVGDSISAFGESTVQATSVTDNGDGTATVVFPAAHGANVGQPVRVNVAQTQALNVMDSKVTAILSPNSFKIQLGGRTHGVVAANGSVSPNIIFPWRRGSRGWFNELEAELGYPVPVTWCAVGGATSAQIAALLDATIMTEVADIVFVCIGMNDAYYGTLFPAAWAGVKSVIDKARAKAAHTVIMSIPPRDSTDAANWTQAKQDVHTQLNTSMYLYAQKIGANYFEMGTVTQNGLTYLDPAAQNPDPTPSFMYDKTHPSARATRGIGSGLAQGPVKPLVSVSPFRPSHRSQIVGNGSGNRLVNADFATSTAGVANTWTVAGLTAGANLASTVEARSTANGDSDSVGYNQVFKFNYGTATGTLAQFYFRRYGVQGLFATPGEILQWLMRADVSNSIGLRALEIFINATLTDGTTWQVYNGGLDGNASAVPGTYSKTLITPPASVPAGISTCDMWVRPLIDATQTTDLTLKFYHPRLIPPP